jgi:hypothetical protein
MLQMFLFHALAARRGDGLRPELLALLESHARPRTGLCAGIEPEEAGLPAQAGSEEGAYSSNGCLPSTPTT